jgi:hypothetical protein
MAHTTDDEVAKHICLSPHGGLRWVERGAARGVVRFNNARLDALPGTSTNKKSFVTK